MHKLKSFLRNSPAFLLLLPVFFVLHGVVENFGLVPSKDALFLLFYYLLLSAVLTTVFFAFYRNLSKAALSSLVVMAFHFFFGAMHDFLRRVAPHTVIVKYSFILPVAFFVFIALVISLKRAKTNFAKLLQYLNLLFLFLILIDAINLLGKFATTSNRTYPQSFRKQAVACDTCSKPDLYLIVSDEYAGKKELADIFSFDNSSFEHELQNRGFHVVSNAKSNYNWTIYSIASLFSMDYLKNLRSTVVNNEDMFTCADIIKESYLIYFFKELGYHIYNCSIFDVSDKPRPVSHTFLPTPRSLITGQTFLCRVRTNLAFHFGTKKQVEKMLKHNLSNNVKVDTLTKIIASQKDIQPKFVYTHLMMPHYSYYFDSNGKENPVERLYDFYKLNKEAYVQYLIYTNKKLLQLIDHIRSYSSRPPVIILMSDHGFRQFNEPVDPKYYFMNLNAVLLPGGNYSQFYDGISNVNQFRAILNVLFKQNLPLLKDSTIFLQEPKATK
jgi:sulfatase-like protein